jgi:hypothetical protein
MGISAAVLSFSIEGPQALTVTLRRSDGLSLTVPTRLSVQRLPDYRRDLQQGLDRFWKTVGWGSTISSLRPALQALHYLHDLGRRLSQELFVPKWRFRVADFIHDACPSWRLAGTQDYIPPLFEVRSRIESLLPFEFMPLFDATPPPLGEDYDTLSQTAARFPSFSAIVHRTIVTGDDEDFTKDTVIHNKDGLRVQLFQHCGVPCADKERGLFEATRGVKCEGIWPETDLPQRDFEVRLAQQIWDGRPIGSVDRPVHFQHFHCHCDTSAQPSVGHWLKLASPAATIGLRRYSERKVTIAALDSAFGGFTERSAESDPYPVIFLNACASGSISPSDVASFAETFLANGNRAVIGTETSIPAFFAPAFSREFYTEFLAGRSVGDAMYRARWKLLKGHKNPLGILYGLFGNPDIVVESVRPA